MNTQIIAQKEIARVSQIISASRKSQATDSRNLNLPGFAEIAGFLAVNVVLPLALGLLDKILYDKYKKIRSKDEVEGASNELAASTSPHSAADSGSKPVPDSVLLADATEKLVSAGVSEAEAAEVAKQILKSFCGR
jgi:hypothetical protein